ncbi:MAG: Ig domain-containing protein [Ruminococcus sp.]|nr:Ig domain-containing protein [Ruminococcus sp.]
MIGKRIVSAATSAALLISMMSVFSGCSPEEFFNGKSNSSSGTAENTANEAVPAASPVSDGVLTNGEWLAMVNDAFGMQVDETSEDGEIEAAKEWGVIGEDETVDLSAPVDDKFVTTTLTRAAGYTTPSSSDEEVIQAAITHGIITSADTSVSAPSQAIASLTTAQESWSHQTFEDKRNIQLAENVINYSEQIDNSQVQITENGVQIPSEYAETLTKDSVFIVPKDEETGQGGAYKTVAVIDNGDGTSTVKSVPASVQEVYQKIDVSGQFGVDYSKVEAVGDGVTVSVGNGATNVSASPESGAVMPLSYTPDGQFTQLGAGSDASVSFSVDLDDDFSVTATLSDVNLNADIDWDFGLFSGLDVNRIYMAVDYTTEVTFESELAGLDEDKFSIEEALAKKFVSEPSLEVGKMAIYICPGISVNLRVKLSLEASGKLEVKVTTANTKGFEMKGSSFRAINETSTTQSLALTGEAGAYMTLILALSLDYLVGEVDLLNLELKVGPTLTASVTVHNAEGTEKDMLCIDVSGYLKIELKLILLKDLMELLDMEASLTLYDCDADSSPIKFFGIHLENFKFTDGCTFEEETTESTETETIPVGIFALEDSYLSIDVGSSATITIKSLPSGYSASDIIWESSDPSKVSVDANGNVTAVTAGSAGITAKTSDGKYSVSCAVNARNVINVSYPANGYQADNYEAVAA